MAKISTPQRITKEGVPSEYRDLINSIGSPYNDFSDQVFNALSKNLSVDDNLNMFYKDINLSVNNTGNPIVSTQFKSTLRGKVRGINVIKVENLTDPNVYPTGAPFITFTENNQVVTILNVTGLSINYKYRITLLSLG